jgi:hypothetical protein
LCFAFASAARAEGDGLSVMAGLQQWIVLRGGNIAAEYKTGRLAFEVSHGQGLDLNQLPSLALTASERDGGARILVPWTTGFGAGVRITDDLHVLIECKAHHLEVAGGDPTSRVTYTTFSVGPGVFYTFHLWRGLFIEPNVRWWPNVASTLSDGADLRRADGSTWHHAPHSFGLFANANLGWAF